MFEADAADITLKMNPGIAAEYEDKEHDHALKRTMQPFGRKYCTFHTFRSLFYQFHSLGGFKMCFSFS